MERGRLGGVGLEIALPSAFTLAFRAISFCAKGRKSAFLFI